MAVWLIWYQKGDWVFLWESEDTDAIWGWILMGWLWFQVCILLAQEIFGPRFFISGNVLSSLGWVNESYFLRHIITLRRIWRMRRQSHQMANAMIVQFACNQLNFRLCRCQVLEATQLH
jgi:hypothetical protein